jgi:tetratricopeptide (TPR) repeat protein
MSRSGEEGAAPAAARYRAFISYAHADRIAADRLHRKLEGFHMPARLVGQSTPIGPVPPRLAPIFRDRDELPAAGDLSAQLQAALADSAFLILISSPASARSKWVNAEVEAFLKLRGRDRLLALIVATDPDDPKRACFPPALAGLEPIAADWRPGHDGERHALLKLVAGLTGVRLDDLVQRDAQRQARRARAVAGGASGVALAMGALAFVAVDARNEAEQRQAQAESLVEYMLTDLRKKLEPVGRLEVLDGVGQRALGYYAEQDAGAMDADALGRRARAQHLIGEVGDLRGDGAAALAAFTEAWKTTGELLARHPGEGQRIFDHAQSTFWVGFTAWKKGDAKTAEARFREYKRLAAELVAIDPGNADWAAEVGYAATNLGIVYLDSGRYREAAGELENALKVSDAAAAAAPADPDRQHQLADTIAWYADASFGRGELLKAVRLRERQEAIYRALLARDPKDARAMDGLFRVRGSAATALRATGELAGAAAAHAEALALVDALAALDPDNAYLQGMRLRLMATGARFGPQSAGGFDQTLARARAAWRANPEANDLLLTYTTVALEAASAELRSGNPDQADSLAAEVAAALRSARATGRKPVEGLHLGEAELIRAQTRAARADRAAMLTHIQAAEAAIRNSTVELEPRARAVLLRAAELRGDAAAAADHRRQLASIGFNDPALTAQRTSGMAPSP